MVLMTRPTIILEFQVVYQIIVRVAPFEGPKMTICMIFSLPLSVYCSKSKIDKEKLSVNEIILMTKKV